MAQAETRVFGLGAAPSVTSTPRAAPVVRPGTVGLDAAGSLRIEPLAGRTVLAAGRDMVLELHRLTARLNFTEKAVAACPCVLTPATCRPVLLHVPPTQGGKENKQRKEENKKQKTNKNKNKKKKKNEPPHTTPNVKDCKAEIEANAKIKSK